VNVRAAVESTRNREAPIGSHTKTLREAMSGQANGETWLYDTGKAVKGKKWWRCCFERGADGSILDLAVLRVEEEVQGGWKAGTVGKRLKKAWRARRLEPEKQPFLFLSERQQAISSRSELRALKQRSGKRH
jgi:hypothetical protein